MSSKKKDASENYKQYSQIEHVLHRPDTYLGSINTELGYRWIIEDSVEQIVSDSASVSSSIVTKKAVLKEIIYNKGIEQCIVELITNAVDHAQRLLSSNSKNQVTKIEITCDDMVFSIKNNGEGIPVEKHKTTGLYIPEMIFGNMLTSSNYDDNEKRTWGGKNGIGAKAANVFSKKFTIEIQCNGMNYVQEFSDNLSKKSEPVIKKLKVSDYTKITFEPDFSRFQLLSFSKLANGKAHQTLKIIEKRCYDASATTNKKVTVTYNDQKINVKDFKDYVSLFIGGDKKVCYDDPNGRWSVIFASNPFEEEKQISFVNGISTDDGGSHVRHIMDNVVPRVVDTINNMNKVKKDNIQIKNKYIKDGLIVFINCLIENPEFNSQTKNKLESKVAKFGSKCDIPDEIITKITKLDFVDSIINLARMKDIQDFQKKTSSETPKKSRNRLTDVPKLLDANKAGTKESMKCTLILTEGDSALSTAKEGMYVVGNDYWGAFPLKGKLLNVRCATLTQLKENEELKNINKILGLVHGDNDISKLRYGKVLILCDSDVDGFHIKGLLMNYFTFYWPDIVSKGFLTTLLTPIVKVTVGKKIYSFYNMNEYYGFLKSNPGIKYSVKYYKGLGTSTASEAKEYFKQINTHSINYEYSKDPTKYINECSKNFIEHTNNLSLDDQRIILAFDKEYSDNRKEWISYSIKNMKSLEVDYTKQNVPIHSFIDKELVQFSIYDNQRSIPNIIDGLKVSQRKIVYGSFLKKIFTEKQQLKVANLGGSISDLTDYHHGEVSMCDTIVNMAQDFVGSNNVNLLVPLGQFGTRRKGGKDSASTRYIFTCFQPWVQIMFNKIDSDLLDYNYNEGTRIEPVKYVPILPLILLNGAEGIGTGWSTFFPSYKPAVVIQNIVDMINGNNPKRMIPWYRGFTGTITEFEKDTRWISRGCFEKNGKEVIITELPIGMWTENFIESVLNNSDLVKYWEDRNDEKNNEKASSKKKGKLSKKSNDNTGCNLINFYVQLENDMSDEEFIKKFKMETYINGKNMVAFNSEGEIHKYADTTEILTEFYKYRLNLYFIRKSYMLELLDIDIKKVSEKIRFINDVMSGSLVIFKRNKKDVIADLIKMGYTKESDLVIKKTKIDKPPSDNKDKEDKEEENDNEQTSKSDYDYLLDLKVHSFTNDTIAKLMEEAGNYETKYKTLLSTSPQQLWIDDLLQLSKFEEFQ